MAYNTYSPISRSWRMDVAMLVIAVALTMSEIDAFAIRHGQPSVTSFTAAGTGASFKRRLPSVQPSVSLYSTRSNGDIKKEKKEQLDDKTASSAKETLDQMLDQTMDKDSELLLEQVLDASYLDLKDMISKGVVQNVTDIAGEDFARERDDMGDTVHQLLKEKKRDELIEAAEGDVLVDDEVASQLAWIEGMVSTKNRDAFLKWIEADVVDPALRVVSSEIGVKEFVEHTIKKETIPDSSKLPLEVLLSRTMDTFEDIAVHLARMPYEKGSATLAPEEDAQRKTVVVLGSGWAAHALMKVVDPTKVRLIVVSPTNHFVFTPMLPSSAVGTVEYRSMTEAVRTANPMIDQYIEGKATHVDVANKKIEVKLNSLLDSVREGDPPSATLDYDHLVVSVGSRVDDRGVPGADNAFRIKNTEDAVKLRRAIGECLEFASRPCVDGPEHSEERTKRATFLIVGGGPTGVELAGEILDLAADITRKNGSYPNLKENIRVVLAHSGSELVPQFEPRLRAEALKSLTKKGAEVILNTRAQEIGDGFAVLSTKEFDAETGMVSGRKECTIPTGLSVWCAGTKPVGFVEELLNQLPAEARNRDGRIKVDKWLRPPMPTEEDAGSILVLGDAAAFPEGDEKITRDKLLPATAQVAGQQGAYAARMLSRGYDLSASPPKLQCTEDSDSCDVLNDEVMTQWLQVRGIATAPKFVFLNLGLLAYLGGGEALTQVQIGDFPLFSYFGSIAFVLWRSVYLAKQVATRNRVLVTFDWIKSSLFGRDITRF